ncbi:molybdopterin molybdotransferase MoeA [Pseudovibrio exalbescens]|nr:gephyrin-like molybdotransferase Glp [Pseudovibrio exalbescens]
MQTGFSHLVQLEKAIRIATTQCCPVESTNALPLSSDALGFVLARDEFSEQESPSFDNSAMDGFAVAAEVFSGSAPWSLPIHGTISAGGTLAEARQPDGGCYRIYTGAPVPEWCTSVVPIENVRCDGSNATFSELPVHGSHIRRKGENVAIGTRLVAKGTRLEPRHISHLIAHGVSQVSVYQPPKVGIFSTGDELAVSGAMRSASQIADSNRPMLIAYAQSYGAQVDDLGIVPDDPDASIAFFETIKGRYDLVVSSGAVSVGGKDFLKEAVLKAGGRLESWRVAMKPGKPVVFARIGSTVYTGLPGNPLAALVGFEVFVSQQIQVLSGARSKTGLFMPGTATFDWNRKSGRSEFFPVRLAGFDSEGRVKLDRIEPSNSASLHAISQADGLGMVPADVGKIAPGTSIVWKPFPSASAPLSELIS